MTYTQSWEAVAAQKRHALEAYLAPWGLKSVPKDATGNVIPLSATSLTEEQISITEMGPGELLAAIKAGNLSSVQVTVSVASSYKFMY